MLGITTIWSQSRLKWNPIYCYQPDCCVSADMIPENQISSKYRFIEILLTTAILQICSLLLQFWRISDFTFACHYLYFENYRNILRYYPNTKNILCRPDLKNTIFYSVGTWNQILLLFSIEKALQQYFRRLKYLISKHWGISFCDV